MKHRHARWIVLCLASCTGAIDGGTQAPTVGMTAGTRPGGAASSTAGMAPAVGPPGKGGATATAPGGTGTATPAATEAPEPPPNLPTIACTAESRGAAPRRLWRLTSRQYTATVSALLSGRKVVGRAMPAAPAWLVPPFEAASGSERFDNYASSYAMSDFELRRTVAMAGELSTALIAQQRKDTKSCLGATPRKLLEDCLRELVTERGPLLFSRPLAADEIAAYVAIGARSAAMLGDDEAAALAVQQMLLAPSFLYRRELGGGAVDAQGRVRLSPYEIAAALAYTLTDAPPDDQLWKVAITGALANPDEVRAQAGRLIGTLAPTSATTLRFVREYFQYDGVLRVFKDVSGFLPSDMLRDTDVMVGNILSTNGSQGFLKALLTSDVGYYSHWTAVHFAIGGKAPYEATRVVFPPGERAGLLTNPSFLMAFSESEANKPVQRGRFLRESLLCGTVPDVPIGVIPALADDPKRTLRERLAQHGADASCAVCHKLMDPLGLAFEGFDHLGRRRTMEAGRAVDASGALADAGLGAGRFADIVDLAPKLAASPAVEECFLRHSFRYWLGRNEQPYDACSIAASVDAYRRSGGDFREALLSLLTSDAFLMRSQNP